MPSLLAYCRAGAMARVDNRVVAKRKQHGSYRCKQHLHVASGQIGAADRSSKERVADEEIRSTGSNPANLKTYAARAMSRRVMPCHLVIAEGDLLSVFVKNVDWWWWFDPQAEQPAHLDGAIIEKKIVAVQIDRCATGTFGRRHSRHVIHVGVREEDVPDRELFAVRGVEKLLHFIAGIDHDGFSCLLAAEDETVLEERTDRTRLNYHGWP